MDLVKREKKIREIKDLLAPLWKEYRELTNQQDEWKIYADTWDEKTKNWTEEEKAGLWVPPEKREELIKESKEKASKIFDRIFKLERYLEQLMDSDLELKEIVPKVSEKEKVIQCFMRLSKDPAHKNKNKTELLVLVANELKKDFDAAKKAYYYKPKKSRK
jgi:hypothetical protein